MRFCYVGGGNVKKILLSLTKKAKTLQEDCSEKKPFGVNRDQDLKLI